MVIAGALALALGSPTPSLRPGLEPMAFLAGSCWVGTIAPGQQDRQCFEPVFAGQHLRSRHEVTGAGSSYAGETLFSWDGRAKRVRYTYWNSLGGISEGFMRPEEGRLRFPEDTYQGADGQRLQFDATWRQIDADSYEAVTTSPGNAALTRKVVYRRVK